MEVKLGNDSFKRRFEGGSRTTTLRESYALETAFVQMMGQQGLYDSWLANSITQTEQDVIDNTTRVFINNNSNPADIT